MNKYNLKNTAVPFQDNLGHNRNSIYFQWYSLALNFVESKIFKLAISKAKIKAPTNICKTSFLNKKEKLINVFDIFHDPSLKACLLNDINFDDPTGLCLLTNLIKCLFMCLNVDILSVFYDNLFI